LWISLIITRKCVIIILQLINNIKTMSEELTLEQLKEELTKRGVEFHHASGLPKLSELWAIHSEDKVIDETEKLVSLEEQAEARRTDTVKTNAKGKYKALRNVKHNGETYKAGKRYDINERDAKQLLKLGYIE